MRSGKGGGGDRVAEKVTLHTLVVNTIGGGRSYFLSVFISGGFTKYP